MTRTLKDAIDAAVEFGERFPDEYDQDVLDHVGYVMETNYPNPNTVVAMAILYAYEHGEAAAYRYCKQAFGIDMR
jgi:hypothetical protein